MNAHAYIRRETMVSIIISLVMSPLVFLATFGSSGPVPVWGAGGFVFDFLPQGFFVGLMASLAPSALARKAAVSGKVVLVQGDARMPRGLVLRGVMCGLAGAIVGVALSAGILAVAEVTMLAWSPALLSKLMFGTALAAIATPVSLRAELVMR
jgi:hypothetical protein